MARIPYPDPTSLPEADRKLLNAIPPLNVFRLLAVSPSLFQPLINFFNAYLSHGLLSEEHREIIILRVGHLCRNPYELFQHERVAREIGMTEERIHALGSERYGNLFDAQERDLIQFVDEVVQNDGASADQLERLRSHFTDAEVMEATIIIGVYIMVCKMLTTFDVEVEDIPIQGSGIEGIAAGLAETNKDKGQSA